MKRLYFILFFLVLCLHLSAQQYSQYNTGTLYDSFENPSQKAFIPDSSRNIAFNFLIPNFNSNITIRGNVQPVIKRRAFEGQYANSFRALQPGKMNYVNMSANAYSFMLKVYTSLDGDAEMGVFGRTKAEVRGVFSDDAAQFFSDISKFGNAPIDNVLNPKLNYQAYNEIGFTYRENITKEFALGFKVSGLLGIIYNKININHSYVNFDETGDKAFLSLAGNYYASFEPGKFNKNDFLPTLKNPGASISIGASYTGADGVKLQWNIKDLGFIHWNKQSLVGSFDNTGIINGLVTGKNPEDSIIRTTTSLMQTQATQRSFTTPTDGLAEFSASKSYWLGYSGIKYSPTLILSKELFYTGFTAALVNHFQQRNTVITVTSSFDDTRIFGFGGQFMVKSPNAEFFIGSDRVWQTASLLRAGILHSSGQINKNGAFSGGNFYLGFSMKIGSVIEHPYNASTIPMGDDRGFLKRLWQRITLRSN